MPANVAALRAELIAGSIAMCGKLGLAPETSSLFESRDDSSAHVEIESDGPICLMVRERGLTMERQQAANLAEMLYWIAKDLTLNMAATYPMRPRTAGPENRRFIRETYLSLMGKISEDYRARCAAEIASNPRVWS